jgi:Xaa-Pro dipeptidase
MTPASDAGLRESDSAPSPLRFSDAELARRHAAVRSLASEQDLSALVLYGTVGAHAEVQYLSDFRVSREAVLVLPVAGEPALFVQYFNHLPTARLVTRIDDVRWGGPDTIATVAADLRARGLAHARLGLVGGLPWMRFMALRQELPDAQFVDCTPALSRLRLVKSEEELAFLHRGATLTDLAMAALEREARSGLSEHELIGIIEQSYLPLGGGTHIHYLATTSMTQPSVCVPSQLPSERRLRDGDVLITEISAHFAGYPGQIQRPYAIGAPPSPLYERLFAVALEAFERIAGIIRPAATAEDVLDAAECIHAAGFSIYDDLVHGFGGGYLAPVLRTHRTSAEPAPPFTFAENMTVVIQPNVITPDQCAGLQVGELVRVTATGVESLHRYPMRFVRCG